MASESWEGLPALLLDDGVGGRTRTQGLCPRPCLSLPSPPGPLPRGRVLPRSAPPEVTHCYSLGGSHAASPLAASRGQHPPRKRLPPRGGTLRRLSSSRRQFCFCCCVTVLARRLFASFFFFFFCVFLIYYPNGPLPVRSASHARPGRQPPGCLIRQQPVSGLVEGWGEGASSSPGPGGKAALSPKARGRSVCWVWSCCEE